MPEAASENKVILGIDPGTNFMGYALIQTQGNSKMELISLGVLFLNKYEDGYEKLLKIFEKVSGLIREYKPDLLAIEAPFYGKNVQSMLKLGRAQGVAIAACLNAGLPIYEYSPRRIKQSITGKGNATKEQVAAMLSRLIQISETPETLDATDALAVAVCHHFQNRYTSQTKKFKGWEAFLKANPDRKA